MNGSGASSGSARTVVVMGVSGSGKTTVGRAVAQRTRQDFIDADDYHSETNVAKMSAGIPLDDDDRWPWLSTLNRALLGFVADGKPVVLACSALKVAYRRALFADLDDRLLVYLEASRDLVEQRMTGRHGHFAPASLADSQFEALEPPTATEALTLDAARSIDDLARVIAEFAAESGSGR